MFKLFGLFMLLSLSANATTITKITLDAGPVSPTGQNTDIYANGQQQARLYLHAYGDDKQPSKDEIINALRLYNNNNNQEIPKDVIENNSLYSLDDHNFADGIIKQNFAFKNNLKDTDCSSSTFCTTVPIYFQISKETTTPICAKINDLSTCSESSDTPVVVNSKTPVVYSPKDFTVNCQPGELVDVGHNVVTGMEHVIKFTCSIQLNSSSSQLRFISSINVTNSSIPFQNQFNNYSYTKIINRTTNKVTFEYIKPEGIDTHTDYISITGLDNYGNLINNLTLDPISTADPSGSKVGGCSVFKIVSPKGMIATNIQTTEGYLEYNSKYNIMALAGNELAANVTQKIPGLPGNVVSYHEQNFCFLEAGDIHTHIVSNSYTGDFNFSNITGSFGSNFSGVSYLYGNNLKKMPLIYLLLDNGLVDQINYSSLQSEGIKKVTNTNLNGLGNYLSQVKFFTSNATYQEANKESNYFFLNDNTNYLSCVAGNYSNCKTSNVNNDDHWKGFLAPYISKINVAVDFWGYSGLFSTYFFLNDGTYLKYDNISNTFVDGAKPINESTWPGLENYATKITAAVAGADGNQYFFINDGTNEDSVIFYDMNNDKLASDGPYKIGDIWPELRNKHIKSAFLVPGN